MTAQENYENLSKEELESTLKEAQELFEEVTEERALILGQRNVHLSSKLVTKYQRELDGIQAKIDRLKKLLEEKS